MIKNKHSLKSFNTFGIDVIAEKFCSVSDIESLIYLLNTKPIKIHILGGGSNILLTKDLEGLVVHINLKGIEVCEKSKNFSKVKVGAGENWHDFVMWAINNNLGGLENLSLIPGNVGAAPIQNIGAYGVEQKNVFHSCEILNLKTLTIETLTKNECKFSYRNSIFKSKLKDKFIILNVTYCLTNSNHNLNNSYADIENEIIKNKINSPTIRNISDAVISIRKSKLPDPKKIGNCGSFFKNPVVDKKKFEHLVKEFPNIPNFTTDDNRIKISAAWLIEKAGFRGKKYNNHGVHKNQALVLVNYGGASGKDILKLSKLIQKTVSVIFGVNLEREVNIF